MRPIMILTMKVLLIMLAALNDNAAIDVLGGLQAGVTEYCACEVANKSNTIWQYVAIDIY